MNMVQESGFMMGLKEGILFCISKGGKVCDVSLKIEVKVKGKEVWFECTQHEVGFGVILLDPGRRVGSLFGRSRYLT
jgi:hypothetical protein